MGVSVTLKIEAQLAPGAWTDLTPDVVASAGVRLRYGIDGNGPLDCVAGTGELTFALRNDARNSGSTQGWYSPVHPGRRTGWMFGIPIRVTMTSGAQSYVKFRGKVRVIDPEPGRYRSQRVAVTAYDGMRDLMEAEIREIAVQIEQSEDALVNAVLDALPSEAQVVARDIDPGVDVYPYAFDDLGGGVKVSSLMKDIVTSGLGLLVMKGDGTLVYRNRHTRATGASAFALNDGMSELLVPASVDKLYNRVRVTIHPKTIDTTATWVLYALKGVPPVVAPGETQTIWGDYHDPENEQVAIGGIGIVAPLVAGTDYAGNGAMDGTGANLTSSLEIVTSPFASTVKFEVTNIGSVPIYLCDATGVAKLQVRGKRVRDLGARTFEASSVQSYGERPLSIDMPYQDDAYVGQSAASYLESQYRALQQQIEGLELIANRSATAMQQVLQREPGDRITVTETITGLAVDAVIQSVELEITAGTWVVCRWGLAPASPYRFWQWGTAGTSEWGVSTVYGF